VKFPCAHFHSFEPALPTFERLKLNKAENPDLNWSIHPFGFSNCDEVITARMPVNASLQTGRYLTEGEPITLDLRDIENFWISQGRPVIDLVKIDCEGGEYCIFDRMSDDMLRSIRAFVMETHPVAGRTYESVAARLREAGFDVRYQTNPDGNADWFAERARPGS
jgi:FkbM family methyltransferase